MRDLELQRVASMGVGSTFTYATVSGIRITKRSKGWLIVGEIRNSDYPDGKETVYLPPEDSEANNSDEWRRIHLAAYHSSREDADRRLAKMK